MTGIPGGIIAGCFALAAFVVAIVAGLAATNPAPAILGRAVIVLIICYPVGLLIDGLCRRIVAAAAADPADDLAAEPAASDADDAPIESSEHATEPSGSPRAVAAS